VGFRSYKNRDNIRNDDWIGINLDTFGDFQSLYSVYVNPLGIQQDSRSEGGTEDFTVDVGWSRSGKVAFQEHHRMLSSAILPER